MIYVFIVKLQNGLINILPNKQRHENTDKYYDDFTTDYLK